MRGHRLALLIMIAFSTEKLSVGSPAIFQDRILTESPRMWTKENSSEHGIPRDLTMSTQAVTCSARYEAVKTP